MKLNKGMIGRFQVSNEMFDHLDCVEAIMKHMVVVSARMSILGDKRTYVAISRLFRKLEDGESVPWYAITVNKPESGVVDVVVKEMEDRPWQDD